MRTLLVVLIVLSVIVAGAIIVGWMSAHEVVTVQAVEPVPLFEPDGPSNSSGAPKPIGRLPAGHTLPVEACVDNKSGITIHAPSAGREVVVGQWAAPVLLRRRSAYPWEAGAIASCRGWFDHVSVYESSVR